MSSRTDLQAKEQLEVGLPLLLTFEMEKFVAAENDFRRVGLFGIFHLFVVIATGSSHFLLLMAVVLSDP